MVVFHVIISCLCFFRSKEIVFLDWTPDFREVPSSTNSAFGLFLNKNVNVSLIKNKTRFLRWLGTITALGLLIYLIQKQGWVEIRTAFAQISFLDFILALVLILISRLAVVGRWYALLNPVEEVTIGQTFRITFAGLFATNFLPTTIGGDVVRLAGAVQLNFSGAVSAASLVVDRLIGMFGMFLALPLGAKPLLHWVNFSSLDPGSFFLGISFSWITKLREKFFALLQKVFQALKVWSEHPKSLILAFLFTIIHMTCLFSMIMLLLIDLEEQLSFGVIAGLWSFVYFVTLMPISINGYGVQELSIAFVFSEVGGVSLQSGITISVLYRTLMIIASLPGALFLPRIIAGEDQRSNPSG